MKVTEEMVTSALEGVRDQYRDENFGPMIGSGIGVTPAAAVTQIMAAPMFAARLSTILTRMFEMAGTSRNETA